MVDMPELQELDVEVYLLLLLLAVCTSGIAAPRTAIQSSNNSIVCALALSKSAVFLVQILKQ